MEQVEQVKQEVREIVGKLERGGTLNYWYDIADRFDRWDELKGEINPEVMNAYENCLTQLEDEGIIKYEPDEEGNDNIIVKL